MYPDSPPSLAQGNSYPSSAFGPSRNDQPYRAAYTPPNQYPQQANIPPPAYSSSYFPSSQTASAPLNAASQQQVSPSSIRAYASDFICNQHVTVCITGNVWVVGIIVGALEFCHKVMGWMYKVEYTSPQTGKTVRGEFPPSHLRPMN